MTTSNLLNVFLILHITGLTLAAGLTIANFFALTKFWRLSAGADHAAAVISNAPNFLRLSWIGLVLLLISGAAMMHIAYQAFMYQSWFQIKLALILLIITNGIFIHSQIKRLRGNHPRPGNNSEHGVWLKRTIVAFSLLQIVFFLLIFVLAVFRFN